MDELQLQLRPFLKEHGFRMQARTCNRATADGLTHVINFQMGRFDPPGTVEIPGFRRKLYGKFTVNIGIYVPEVAIAQFWIKPRSFVQEVDCCLRTRLAQLSGISDLWWDLPAGGDTANELRLRFDRDAFPYLARHETRELVLRELELGRGSLTPRIARAIILAHRGERGEAQALLRAQVEGAAKGHRDYVQQVAERLGLGPLDDVAE